MKSIRECVFSCELDPQTLVCTLGRDFPLARLADRPTVNGGILHKGSGVWIVPSADVGDKPISGGTVADLGRDGLLTLSVLDGSASARLTARGNWFARTVVTEIAERPAP